ncbi:type IV secretory system conjugative DNA transfer family protein [Vibrio chagasii]|uniref:type IV secretory system conjugative DNA transfer family protein n=1 Tax=Vibrio chagasii TaxID=170679 RepID=UPI0022841727|nr:type IV secretory system conjugative DNA transfer family protein [Vibrio chagasii]MCY9828604.1 type IV secretory system conjugative DNA transfer family protein [Vibrio chagasii]
MQPINPNNALKNGHVFAVGMSGSGKTSAAKKLFIKSTDQVAMFDPMGDYSGNLAGRVVRGYSNIKEFAAALIAGRKTKQGFKIAYQPTHETTSKDFDKFCQVVWAMGNGKHTKPLKIICEEVAEHSENAGKAVGYHGKILRLGRKFNLHTINLFQRGQEVSKTIIDNCQHACVMMQKTKASATYLEKMTGIPADAIEQLDPLEYLLQDGKAFKKGVIRW